MPLGTVLRRQSDFFQTHGSGQSHAKGIPYAAMYQAHQNYIKDVSSENTTPIDCCFSSDGLKMYMIGTTGADRVFQYTCSVAWDPTTASYDSKSFTVTHSGLQGLGFNEDGTVLYTFATTHPCFKQYTLSTAWDVSTAGSATNCTLNLSTTLDTACRCFKFFNDGSNCMIAGGTSNTFYMLTLSTAYDITTLAYPGTDDYTWTSDFSSDVYGFGFNFNGTQLVCGTSTGELHYFDLASAYTVTGMTHQSEYMKFKGLESAPYGCFVKGAYPDYAYFIGGGNDTVYRIHLATYASSWNQMSYQGDNKSVNSEIGTPYCMTFKDDGTKMYISGNAASTIYCFEYDLSTPWDVSTATYNSNKGNIDQGSTTYPTGLAFNLNGTELYVSYQSHTYIESYSLSTAWDISTVSANMTSPTFTGYGSGFGVLLSPDGLTMFICHQSTNQITEWALSVAGDITTATWTQTLSIPSDAGATCMGFDIDRANGHYMYICTTTDDFVHAWYMPNAWSLTNAYYRGTAKYVGNEEINTRDCYYKSGYGGFIVGTTNDTVYHYEP